MATKETIQTSKAGAAPDILNWGQHQTETALNFQKAIMETCEQASRVFNVTVTVLPTPNPSFRRVDAQVFDGTSPVLKLSTVLGRY